MCRTAARRLPCHQTARRNRSSRRARRSRRRHRRRGATPWRSPSARPGTANLEKAAPRATGVTPLPRLGAQDHWMDSRGSLSGYSCCTSTFEPAGDLLGRLGATMPRLGRRRRGPESLVVGGIALTPHRLFVCTVIGGLVLALALMITFHLTKPKKRKPVLAVDFDEVCVGYLAAFIEFNNETYGTTLQFDDFQTCVLSRAFGDRSFGDRSIRPTRPACEPGIRSGRCQNARSRRARPRPIACTSFTTRSTSAPSRRSRARARRSRRSRSSTRCTS